VNNQVLIVVPTRGKRLTHLKTCLQSIVTQSPSPDVLIVGPLTSELQSIADSFHAQLIADPGSQTMAINRGVAHATAHGKYAYVNWLGDDDLLESGSLAATTKALDSSPHSTVAYGACRYIDNQGEELWVNRAGKWGPRILSWGPDLIPQPGMLVRMSAWESVGGVDETYRFAFDLDLLLKLKKLGPLIDVNQIVSSFRWHPDSLTVGDRSTNIQESERAKRAALSPAMRRVAWMWESPVRVATRLAAAEVNRRARKLRP